MKRKGRKLTDEQRALISERVSRWWTPERRAAYAEKQRGNKHALGLVRAPFTEEHRAKLWEKRDRAMSEEQKAKVAEAQRGRKHSVESRVKRSIQKLGPLNPNWKGGRKAESRMIRERVETKLWREVVFARDDHTCGICLTRGGYIEAHHIKPVGVYESLRYDVANGMTLCKKCHVRITALHHSLGIYRAGADAPALAQAQ